VSAFFVGGNRCSVCGGEFDPDVFQVIVPGIPGVFDTFECAREAAQPVAPGVLQTLIEQLRPLRRLRLAEQ
jgi:hypothetical protein